MQNHATENHSLLESAYRNGSGNDDDMLMNTARLPYRL
jgi:hypothetical protein